MKTVILVAVRLHSKRLPRKALIRVGKKTILEHLINRVRRARESENIIICTSTHPSDGELIKLAEKIGVTWFAGSENDVLGRFIEAAEWIGAETVVHVTGDNPLTEPEVIDFYRLAFPAHAIT